MMVLYSSVGTYFYFWWWKSNVIVGSYEIRTGGVGYGHDGRNGCIGGITHVGVGWLSEECEGHRQPLGASNEPECWWLDKRLRARLVAKWHVQKTGIYYDETFSRVAPYDTVRGVLAVPTLEKPQFASLMWRRHFSMGQFRRQSTCVNQRGSKMEAVGYASSSEACTVSSKALCVGISGL